MDKEYFIKLNLKIKKYFVTSTLLRDDITNCLVTEKKYIEYLYAFVKLKLKILWLHSNIY